MLSAPVWSYAQELLEQLVPTLYIQSLIVAPPREGVIVSEVPVTADTLSEKESTGGRLFVCNSPAFR